MWQIVGAHVNGIAISGGMSLVIDGKSSGTGESVDGGDPKRQSVAMEKARQ